MLIVPGQNSLLGTFTAKSLEASETDTQTATSQRQAGSACLSGNHILAPCGSLASESGR